MKNRKLNAVFALFITAFLLSFSIRPNIVVAQIAPNTAAPSRVFGIQLDANAQSTTLNVRMDKASQYRIFALTAPTPRIVIDFNKIDWAMGRGVAGTLQGRGLVRQMRYASKSATESRLVLDLTGPVRIVSQTYSGIVGAKTLSIVLAPSNNQAFANSAPKIIPKNPVLGLPSPISPNARRGRYVIVIDAGHGGHDPGAIGFTPGVKESNITLANAQLLAAFLRQDPRFQVVLTRDSDVFLPLERRIIIARDIRADLFISLHADAAPPNTNAQGATVYTLSEQGGERSRRLLNRDNWTVAPTNRSNDNIVTEILRDLTQRDTKNQSAVFAEGIIRNIKTVGPVTSSSHRRAGFFVLLSPTVPAVLLEIGFVTNPNDQARLIDVGFRRRQMGGVARAIDSYFDQLDIRRKTK